MRWNPRKKLSKHEQKVADKLRRSGKFFVFLREIRAELFNNEFQAELSAVYSPRGQQPVPPALLAMVTLLQVYTQTGDAEAVIAAQMDRRWQLVLGTLHSEDAEFGQGSLVRFRERMIEHDLDKRLIDRTVALAKESEGFGWKKLQVAMDSSPLIGAGRVEDTWNLIGRAIRHLVRAVSTVLEIEPSAVIEATGLTLVDDSRSTKVLLNIDWDDRDERHRALQQLLEEASAVRVWVEEQTTVTACGKPPLSTALENLQRVTDQDLEPDPDGTGTRIRRGVARDRMPSLGDQEMRHGRKSKAKAFNGYKRHIARLVEQGIIVDALVLPANQAEHIAATSLLRSAEEHGVVDTVLIDRGYLASPAIIDAVDRGAELRCKAWPLRNRGLYTKADFELDLKTKQASCPAGETASFRNKGRVARFPRGVCAACKLRPACTRAEKNGRSVSIHAHEELLNQLRNTQKSPAGRRRLRQRVVVEHSLARVGQIQGRRARYRGTRKNTFDLRRTAVVANLMTISSALHKAAA